MPTTWPIWKSSWSNRSLREIADRLTQQQAVQAARLDRHEEVMLRLAQTLDAIKDMLDRGNGH